LNASELDDAPGLEPLEGERPRAAGEGAFARVPFDRVPFEDVYERYFEFVWRSLRMLGVAHASLDDAVLDVFGAISRQLPRFEGRSSLRTWVYGITQYTAANHRRAMRRKSAPLEPLHLYLERGYLERGREGGHQSGLESAEPRPDAHAEARQLADVIQGFCDELDEGRRTVFVLGLLEEVPAAEIAELLAIPVNTVYSRKRALERALRDRLEQHERGPSPSAPGRALAARGRREVDQ
jgi:RNA polymerase sigma-70 factor (ECF subfamily)